MSNWTDDFGHELVGVHETCVGEFCPIHKPSNHPLKGAKQRWSRYKGRMERVCSHDIAHPDPDDYKYRALVYVAHPCDGCCTIRQD